MKNSANFTCTDAIFLGAEVLCQQIEELTAEHAVELGKLGSKLVYR
jgi:hypothetical protein